MKHLRKILLIAAAAISLGVTALPLPARAIDRVYFRTHNNSTYKVWITIQDAGKLRNLDSGWVEPMKMREWYAGHYLTGSYYFVRYEFVDSNDKVLCSTRARTFIEYEANNFRSAYGHFDGRHKCYIDVRDRAVPF
jgi:hypothetical protein